MSRAATKTVRCAVDDYHRGLFLQRPADVWRGRRVCGLRFYDGSCGKASLEIQNSKYETRNTKTRAFCKGEFRVSKLRAHGFLWRGKKVRRNSRTTDSAGSASRSGTTSTSSSCTSAETSAKSDFAACLSGTADGPRPVGDGTSDCATSGVTPGGARSATCSAPPIAT